MAITLSREHLCSPHTTRCWCPHTLPNGTKGHWVSLDQAGLLLCSDPNCPSHGRIVYQCPIHRGVVCLDGEPGPASAGAAP